MIADLAKYISTLHEKGKYILEAYGDLKKHLDELRNTIDLLKRENERQKVNNTYAAELVSFFPIVISQNSNSKESPKIRILFKY